MADKDIVLSLKIDSEGAITNIDKVEQSMEGVTGSTQSLRSELRKLQQQLATLDPNSKEFDELSRKAGQLRDKMNDAAEATRANAGPAFAQLGNNARLLKDRFLELDFEGIGQSFNALGSSVKGLKLKDLQEGIGQAANGFVNLGKTLLANPIFLLATAIGVLIANFDKLKEAIDFGINPATRALVEETTRASEASKAAYEAFDLEERRLRALGVAESEIAEQRKKITKERIESLKAETQATVKRLSEELAANAALQTQGISGKLAAKFLGPSDEDIAATKEKLAQQTKELKEFDVILSELVKKQTDEQKAQNQKRNEDAKQAAAERQKIREKEAEEARLLGFELEEMFQEMLADFEARQEAERVAALQKESELNKQRIEQEDAQFALSRDLFEKETEKQIADTVLKYEKLFEVANGNAELEKELEIRQAKEIGDIRQKAIDDEIEAQEKLKNAKIGIASDTIGALIAFNDAFAAKNEKQARRQFQINKGLQIAQALISTYQAANNAFATASASPITSVFPAYPFIQAGLAVAAGLAQVAKIKATQFDGGGGGGGSASASIASGGAGGGASGPPAFNPVDTSFIGNRPNQLTPAYVLAGQVTTAQEAREKIENQSRL